MPNYCMNVINVTGPVDTIKQFYEAAQRGEFCNAVVPVPDMLRDTVAGPVGKPGSQEQIAQEIQENINLELFGYKNWYDFSVNEWGVKWDMGTPETVSITDNHNGTATLTVNDDSAWAPPLRIFEKLYAREFDVLAYYYEPGMAFCGRWHNGNDEYYNIVGDSDWVDANIPSEINETFTIAESMSEWEQTE
jgi:hypothetical protein